MKNEQSAIPLPDRVRLIRIQTFFKNAAGNPVSLMGVGALSALLLFSAGVPGRQLSVWLVLIFLGCTITLLFERYVRRVGLSLENADHLFRIRFLFGSVVCALFGATVFFLPGLVAGTAHTYVFIITTSIVAV